MSADAGHRRSADNGAFRLRRAGGALVVAALAATIAVPILLGGKDALYATLRLPAQGYLALFALLATSWLARAVKLRMLLRRLDVQATFLHVLAISLAMDFAFMATPGGVGGYAAGVYYLRRTGASVGAAATLTAADQGLDLLFFALALPLAGLTLFDSFLPQAWKTLAAGTLAFALMLALGAAIARYKWAALCSRARSLGARWPSLHRHARAWRDFAADLRAHARLLAAGGPLFLCGVFAFTALQWLTRYGILWLALALLGYRVSFALTLSLQALVIHAAQWTGVPAGGGGAELGLSATLAAWVPAADLATALLLWRMATLYLGLIVGAAAIALLARAREPRAKPSSAGALAAEECAN